MKYGIFSLLILNITITVIVKLQKPCGLEHTEQCI